jgi:hypothetical protein
MVFQKQCFWPLAAGCWLLAAGYWLLASRQMQEASSVYIMNELFLKNVLRKNMALVRTI